MSKDSRSEGPCEKSLQNSSTTTGGRTGKIIQLNTSTKVSARADSVSTRKIVEYAKRLKW